MKIIKSFPENLTMKQAYSLTRNPDSRPMKTLEGATVNIEAYALYEDVNAKGDEQEVLAVLLGAESEAKRIVEDSKSESDGFLRSAQEKFAMERTNQMASAREQAKGIMETALNSARTEAEQIADLGKEERVRMQKRFEENVDPVIDSMISETAERFISKTRRGN